MVKSRRSVHLTNLFSWESLTKRYVVLILSLVIDNKVRKRARIRNQYNQAPILTQDNNGKVATTQLDITNESQEISPVSTGDHKARKHNKKDRYNINDPQKKYRLGTVCTKILLEGLNRFYGLPALLENIS